MIESILAGVTLALCGVLMVRLLLPSPRRQRFDAALRRGWFQLRVRAVTLWRWRSLRRQADQAARDAIERAAGRARGGGAADDGEWKGNVYSPKSFRKPRKPH